MSTPGYNENSTDAMFARILQRMETQDQTLGRIEAGVLKTNGRVTALERDRWYQRGVVATIGLLAAGTYEYVKTRW